ncbi:MAG: VanZ family protein [Gallionella sp.]|jgi:VanZ family protein|nr:VanZ family protein [Gallionella sp.]MCK9353028.1 VanZ family protein [Gallionella sp.]
MHKLRKPWLALGWLWVATVVYLSLAPSPPEPVHIQGIDKLEHALAYCLLMLWFCQVYVRRTQRLFAAVLLIALGMIVELLQGMTGYRYFEYADMLANATGVMLGWVWSRTGLGRIGRALETRFFK